MAMPAGRIAPAASCNWSCNWTPTPCFFGSVDSGKVKVEIYGSVDYRRLQMADNERDTKCATILGSVDFKGT
jgi:hypothetical protein